MRIDDYTHDAGVVVHFDAKECELFMRLASDIGLTEHAGEQVREPIAQSPQTYFSISLALGQQIQALAKPRQR